MYTEYIQFLHIIFLKEIKNTDKSHQCINHIQN